MSVATKKKREERSNIWAQMQALEEGARSAGRSDLDAEELRQWNEMDSELDRLAREIEFDEKREARALEMARPEREKLAERSEIPDPDPDNPTDDSEYRQAFGLWMRAGTSALEREQRQVLQRGWVSGKEFRAQGVGSGAAGGYTVPQGFRNKIQETKKAFGGVRSVAEIIDTDTGQDLPWPTNDDTANMGAILAENTQVTEQDVTMGQKTLHAFMYTSKLVRVSLQLLQDSGFDVEAWLARKLAMRIARIQNVHFTTGVGTTQPEGVQTNAVVGKVGAAGQVTSITGDDLIDLIYSVDAAYRASGRARFMAADGSIGKFRKLKDDNGQYLWQPSLQAGEPDSIFGYGITANNDMPVMAASAKSVLFGDFFEGYVIRDVSDFQLLRLEERYADFLQVGFLGFQRGDGMPQDTAAYKAYQNPAA